MRAITFLALSAIAMAIATPVIAGDPAFTGTFSGTGRACSGSLKIRTKTIEWTSSFSVCKPTGYEILDKDPSSDHQRIAYRLKSQSKHCRYAVVEIEHVSNAGWNVNGYQSLDAYKNREAPEWKNSAVPERQVLSCPMIGPD